MKKDQQNLPNNQPLTLAVMSNLENKFRHNLYFQQLYVSSLKDDINKGHAVKLTKQQICQQNSLSTSQVPPPSLSK